jgi:hypothetical protein
MSDRTEKNADQKSRSDNYHSQIVATKDYFLSLIPPEHIFYQLTIQCRRDKLDNTAYKADRVKNVIETVYKRLNETFVHPRRYADARNRQFMPYLLAMIEFDDKVMFHAHCLVATCPTLADKFDALRSYDTFKKFDSRISSSHFERTIQDDKDIESFDEPTNVEKWVNYLLKQNRSVTPKKPKDLLTFSPKQ